MRYQFTLKKPLVRGELPDQSTVSSAEQIKLAKQITESLLDR